jgi:hypothetical protein
VPERCGDNMSSSKGIVCGYLRSTCGKKMDGVQWPQAITPDDHVPSSKIFHKEAQRVKFH